MFCFIKLELYILCVYLMINDLMLAAYLGIFRQKSVRLRLIIKKNT